MIMIRNGSSLPGPKDVYTTAEAAKLCCVHKNTVIAAINRGLLRSMKTPGGHNRVARHDLLEYMRRSGIAVPDWADPPPARVMVVGESPAVVSAVSGVLPHPRFDVQHCRGLFEAGRRSANNAPAVLILDVALGATGFGDARTEGPALLGLHDGVAPPGDQSMFDAVLDRAALGALESAIAALM